MEIRTSVPQSEVKLHKITKFLSDISYWKKVISGNSNLLTVRQLCKIGQVVDVNISDQILNRKVTEVAQCGSRMSRNSLIVQMDEDGDDVVRWGFANGAIAAITRSQIDNLPCIVVEHPEDTYVRMCQYFRCKSSAKMTVVAGSIGKTTTKRMINSVYSTFYNTFNDPENENQLPCVGYAVQHIPKLTEMSVSEISEDTPGCLHKMMQILLPEVAVITAIDKSHIEAFGSEQAVYDEVATVLSDMPENGIAIINLDDKALSKYNPKCVIKTISINCADADYFAKNIIVKEDGLYFSIVEKQSGKIFDTFLNHIYAKHNVYTALYAFVAGVSVGIPYEKCIEGITRFETTGIRQNVYTDIRENCIIYADCYNAVARSVKSAVETASEIPIKGQRVVVLGDIEEAGAFSVQTHTEIVEAVNNSKFDVLVVYGMKLKKAVSSMNFRKNLEVVSLDTKNEIVSFLKKKLKKKDLILFKASRKSALESIIKEMWPITYKMQMMKYYWAILKWRLKVIFS